MNLSIPSSLNTAIIIFRWAALFSGFVSIDYGSPNRPLFLQQVPQIIFFFLFVYHLAATLFLIKGLETRSGFLFLLLLDISLGVFLVYASSSGCSSS
ncbi:MAG: hypothetical protein HYU64_08265 [Armatimonadetes bacterium]|nr:hypothetical protein [Armatimonadota bacterium]